MICSMYSEKDNDSVWFGEGRMVIYLAVNMIIPRNYIAIHENLGYVL